MAHSVRRYRISLRMLREKILARSESASVRKRRGGKYFPTYVSRIFEQACPAKERQIAEKTGGGGEEKATELKGRLS